MFRRLAFVLVGLAIWPMSTMAQTSLEVPGKLYVGGAIGQSTFWDVELDGGGDLEFDLLAFFLSGLVGYRLSPNFRTEAEWLFESADIDDSTAEIEVIRGTISGYYDLAPTRLAGFSNVRPYVGGGAGLANVEIVDDENELTWHAEAGLSVPVFDRVEFVPGIRFEYTFLDDGAEDDLWITQLRAGLRYNF